MSPSGPERGATGPVDFHIWIKHQQLVCSLISDCWTSLLVISLGWLSDCNCIKNTLFLQSSLLFKKGENPDSSSTSSFNTDKHWSRTKSRTKMLLAGKGGGALWFLMGGELLQLRCCVLSPAWPSQDSAWRRLGIIWGPSGETHALMRSIKQCASSVLFPPTPLKTWCKTSPSPLVEVFCITAVTSDSCFALPPSELRLPSENSKWKMKTVLCEQPSTNGITWLSLLAIGDVNWFPCLLRREGFPINGTPSGSRTTLLPKSWSMSRPPESCRAF